TGPPAGALTVLSSCDRVNGAGSYAGVIQGADGNFYGTTQNGGRYALGNVYRVTSAGTVTTVMSFGGADGASPFSVLAKGSDGSFYGTTSAGGSANVGGLFKLV